VKEALTFVSCDISAAVNMVDLQVILVEWRNKESICQGSLNVYIIVFSIANFCIQDQRQSEEVKEREKEKMYSITIALWIKGRKD
jgi:hypothetical protein